MTQCQQSQQETSTFTKTVMVPLLGTCRVPGGTASGTDARQRPGTQRNHEASQQVHRAEATGLGKTRE